MTSLPIDMLDVVPSIVHATKQIRSIEYCWQRVAQQYTIHVDCIDSDPVYVTFNYHSSGEVTVRTMRTRDLHGAPWWDEPGAGVMVLDSPFAQYGAAAAHWLRACRIHTADTGLLATSLAGLQAISARPEIAFPAALCAVQLGDLLSSVLTGFRWVVTIDHDETGSFTSLVEALAERDAELLERLDHDPAAASALLAAYRAGRYVEGSFVVERQDDVEEPAAVRASIVNVQRPRMQEKEARRDDW